MTTPQDNEARKVTTLRDLPQVIEPGRDLWPAIEARLNERQAAAPPAAGVKVIPPHRSGTRLRWLAAAAMVASVAVGVWIGRSLLPGTVQPGTAQVARVEPPAGGQAATVPPGTASGIPGAPTALDASYVNDPRYERQRAALLRSLQTQLAALPPQTRAKVTASLATIEKAKEDLEQALGKDPGNALLQELLINTYQDEMRVLTDVHEASDPGRGI
jgi:hypothetical protein